MNFYLKRIVVQNLSQKLLATPITRSYTPGKHRPYSTILSWNCVGHERFCETLVRPFSVWDKTNKYWTVPHNIGRMSTSPKPKEKDEKKEKDNLSAVLHGIEDLRLEQRPIPKIKENEVLLEMDCVGICGSDVHFWVRGHIGDFVVKKPMIIGHESSGIVAKCGQKVKHLKPGDRVAIEPGVPCRMCEFCKLGKYHLCPDVVFCATPPNDGTLTKFYRHAADFCYKLPSHMTMEEGALLEPLSVGVHTCRRADVGLGSEVLICGAGPIGLATLLVAQAMGASNIVITDLFQHRLDFAKCLGAHHTLLIENDATEEETLCRLKQLMPNSPEKTLDCCATESTTRLAALATRSGGVVAVVGMASMETKLPLSSLYAREVDIRGVFRYCNDYPAALSLVASKKVDVKSLVTHHFEMKDTLEAFTTARCGHGNPIKVMIHCQPRDKNNPQPF